MTTEDDTIAGNAWGLVSSYRTTPITDQSLPDYRERCEGIWDLAWSYLEQIRDEGRRLTAFDQLDRMYTEWSRQQRNLRDNAYYPLYTIGYSLWDWEALTDQLKQHRAILGDIRHQPRSHNATWRKETLQGQLKGRYIHLPEFGNQHYKDGVIALVNPDQGIAKLKHLLAISPVILMCACGNHRSCHRLEVAQRVEAEVTTMINNTVTPLIATHLYPTGKTPQPKDDSPQLPLLTL
jgi:hypothetical protein